MEDQLPNLEEQGIQRLGPEQEQDRHRDRALELKRLAKSLLLNFLELLGVLSIDPIQVSLRLPPSLLIFPSPPTSMLQDKPQLTHPGKAEEKLNDLRTLLINFHHTLNEYRPHQARESTIALMQEHLDRTRAETAAVREAVERTRRVIEGLGSVEVPPEGERSKVEGGDAGAREVEVWAAADELLA